jgi:hypothetical protein
MVRAVRYHGLKATITHCFELDCVTCGRLEKKIVQILHESGLEREYCKNMSDKTHVQECIHP